MIQGNAAEQVLNQSREVIHMDGEWELADIHVTPITVALVDASYSEIVYHVSAFIILSII